MLKKRQTTNGKKTERTKLELAIGSRELSMYSLRKQNSKLAIYQINNSKGKQNYSIIHFLYQKYVTMMNSINRMICQSQKKELLKNMKSKYYLESNEKIFAQSFLTKMNA
mgnify:CR=1 FL=1